MPQSGTLDVIAPNEARTLAGLLRVRVQRTPDAPAYRQYDAGSETWRTYSWADTAADVARWRAALAREGLVAGDRVAILLRNCREWVLMDQAALANGLVVVPLYTEDRPDNVAYILNDAGVKLLLIQGKPQWQLLREVCGRCEHLVRIVTLDAVEDCADGRVAGINNWIAVDNPITDEPDSDPAKLATIVYTSGTTGKPKGVMLSHANILWNAHASLRSVPVFREDSLLSFLPLSHTFERTAGYYLPMMAGCSVSYARSIPQLAEDLQSVRPTCLVAVPRIFERVHNRIQGQLESKRPLARALFRAAVNVGWRRFEWQQGRAGWHPSLLLWPLLKKLVAGKVLARMGGRLRFAVCGGAPLSPEIARLFVGLGLPMLQGYGMTESSPVIAANKLDCNDPASVGPVLADVTVRIGPGDELLVKSPGVMLGYWNNAQATADVIDSDGWLHTGDKARIDDGRVYITGRLKEILVLANGEKVPPADMEMAIAMDPLFEQVMVIGDGRPFLSVLAVVTDEHWQTLASALSLDAQDPASLTNARVVEAVLRRIAQRLHAFPGYAQVRRVVLSRTPWTVDAGLITPTLKLRRAQIMEKFAEEIAAMYAGH